MPNVQLQSQFRNVQQPNLNMVSWDMFRWDILNVKIVNHYTTHNQIYLSTTILITTKFMAENLVIPRIAEI